MDEDFNDTVDTPTDMDFSDMDVSDDIPTDIPDDIPEDVTEDDYSDADISVDVSEDVSEEPAVDDIEYDETDESIEEDSIEPETDELDESIDDIEEDSLEELEDTDEDHEELDDILEDTNGFDENLENEINETEDILEDTDNIEMSDYDETFDEDIPEDLTDIEAAEQPEDVSDIDDTKHSDLETYDYETSPETHDVVNPETSGEYASADNQVRERWEKFADEFSDGKDESDGWDSLKDVLFAEDVQSDAIKGSDASMPTESNDTSEISSISDYMNAHNYGPDDFATYSQDSQWRQLMRQEYPDFELPELTQENAHTQLSRYMNDHNYGVDDYAEYSQDSIWRELHSAAFPDDELPPLMDASEHPADSAEFTSMVDLLEKANVEYRPIELHDGEHSENEIVEHLSGGDLTKGSCSSLAFAYAGNKGGYDVLDFRDGESRSFFSSRDNIQKVANLSGVKSTILSGTNDIDCANRLLDSMSPGKEYYLATGQHASIVRNTGSDMEYLELQHPTRSGWHKLDDNILMNRFGCRSSHTCEFSNYLMDVDSLSNSKEFVNILGYINTAGPEQRKGSDGNVR